MSKDDKYIRDFVEDEIDDPQFFDWAREKGGNDELFQKCVHRFEKKYIKIREKALIRKNTVHNLQQDLNRQKAKIIEFKKVMIKNQKTIFKLKLRLKKE